MPYSFFFSYFLFILEKQKNHKSVKTYEKKRKKKLLDSFGVTPRFSGASKENGISIMNRRPSSIAVKDSFRAYFYVKRYCLIFIIHGETVPGKGRTNDTR